MPLLQQTFAREIEQGQLKLIENDALEFEPSDYKLEARSYKLVGNIPYYITGALLKKFLSGEVQPSLLVFLVQKEVAERIARNQKESILSLSIKAYGDVSYVKTVPRGAFVPPPKVDSAILKVKNISRKNFTSKAHEARFFELLHKGFGSKRKFLKRNLEPLFGNNYSDILENIGIPANARAEDVPLQKWLGLAKI